MNRALFAATRSGNEQAAVSLLHGGADPYEVHDLDDIDDLDDIVGMYGSEVTVFEIALYREYMELVTALPMMARRRGVGNAPTRRRGIASQIFKAASGIGLTPRVLRSIEGAQD